MKNAILIVSLFFIQFYSYAQGCSDAGFCTLDANSSATQSTDKDNTMLSSVSLGFSFGKAEYDISVVAPYLTYKRYITENTKLETKVTSSYQEGNGVSSSGLSDLFLYSTTKLKNNASYSFGLKIPFNKGNETWYNEAADHYYTLPLNYQNSLGTFDLLLGSEFSYQNIHMSVALQQPLTQNENAFIAGEVGQDSAFVNFQTTNGFGRKGDILTRFTYPISLAEHKLNFSPAMLFIYHLGKDTYTEKNDAETLTKVIEGSDGLTVNATMFLDYSLNSSNVIRLFTGVPLLVREARPDGLTRSFVAGLDYSISF